MRVNPIVITQLSLTASLAPLTGCMAGSLATNSGPCPSGSRWSNVVKQSVHVGETVQFEFVLHNGSGTFIPADGLADYCAAIIGNDRVESESDSKGRFHFTYTFDQQKSGDLVPVTATAYRERGQRDFVKVGGRWLKSDKQYDQPDSKVASDTIQLSIYEVPIVMTISGGADYLDAEGGVLRLRRSDGTIASIYINRPNRRGFILDGPAADGTYTVTYHPRGNELNATGTTEAEFTIHDVLGKQRRVTTTVQTP